ncbi:MAG: hypothetical protein V1704_02010 [Candidatus Vogelbacteria bacterium]
MKKGVLAGLVLVAATMNIGCVKTTRVMMDKEGKPTEEVTTWEPLALPVTVYHGPVEYVDDYYPPSRVVVRERYHPRYRPVRVYHEPRTLYIGHRPHHRRW